MPINIEFIESEFAKEGYKLLTTEYINSNQKLEYICPKGHQHNITWHSWQRGRRCFYCYGTIRKTIEFIRSEFEKEGYSLISTKYINCGQKLRCMCSKGHKYDSSWNRWQQKIRCPYCFNEKFSMKYSGVNSWNWKGGIACEPYCPVWLDKEFKNSILERDNYKCQNPDCWGTSKKLTGHHIDYNKKNCDPSNVITLCQSCNSRANKNREYWTKFYREIMNKKYGYKYGESNE